MLPEHEAIMGPQRVEIGCRDVKDLSFQEQGAGKVLFLKARKSIAWLWLRKPAPPQEHAILAPRLHRAAMQSIDPLLWRWTQSERQHEHQSQQDSVHESFPPGSTGAPLRTPLNG